MWEFSGIPPSTSNRKCRRHPRGVRPASGSLLHRQSSTIESLSRRAPPISGDSPFTRFPSVVFSLRINGLQMGSARLVCRGEEMVERRLHSPPLLIHVRVIVHGRPVSEQKLPATTTVHSSPSMKVRSGLGNHGPNLSHHSLALILKAWASHDEMERVLDLALRAASAQAQ